MKKLLLGAFALIATAGIANANTLTVTNLTGCPYTLSISGYGYATIGTGTYVFNSLSGTNIDAAKVLYVFASGANTGLGVGLTSPYANTAGQPTPPCLTAAYFTASWSQGSATANASLVIFN
ncbi:MULTISPECIES: hypothetical protein [Edaphocola]|uniref:hypothetical protein n=1 Tax=Edaphocola TaxID=2601681 RepID=UPI000FA47DD1|nr:MULTISPECIES: hypothetical protein [Edaphocola]